MTKTTQQRKQYLKEYRKKNKIRLADLRHKKYRQKRKNSTYVEKTKEYHRNYYHKNKEKYTGYRKKRWQTIKNNPKLYQENKERVNKWRATPSGIYISLRNRGRKDFDLTKKEFIEWYKKQPKQCHYCGLTIEQINQLPYPYNRKNGLIKYSIDRKDNSKGYILDNIILCCFACNTIKNNFLTYKDMKKIGKEILIPKFAKLLN